MGQFGPEHLRGIKKGITLFNNQMYWECHEELEDYWRENPSDNARYVFWAVIQVATAAYHYRNNNILGVQGLIKKTKDKLEKCESLKVETPLLYKFLNWDELKNLINNLPEKGELGDYKKVFEFRFSPSPENWELD